MLHLIQNCERVQRSGGHFLCYTLTFEFFRNVFPEFAEFNDKDIVSTVKGFKPAIFCVRDQDATTAPTRHK